MRGGASPLGLNLPAAAPLLLLYCLLATARGFPLTLRPLIIRCNILLIILVLGGAHAVLWHLRHLDHLCVCVCVCKHGEYEVCACVRCVGVL